MTQASHVFRGLFGRVAHPASSRTTSARRRRPGPAGRAAAPVGDEIRVKAVAKVTGMVNVTPDFIDHAKVVNGCSELFVKVLGEAGYHARSAVGMGSLPFGVMVETEAIVIVRD